MDFADVKNQFILTAEDMVMPDSWSRHRLAQWTLLTSGLPVIRIVTDSGRDIGWCLGFLARETGPEIRLKAHDGPLGAAIEEQLCQELAGRYLLIILDDDHQRVYLDSGGSLSIVYSTRERILASTPSLFPDTHEWNEQLSGALGMPASDLWYPSGLTARHHVRRLLPNHYLDLERWDAIRHWPREQEDLAVDTDVEAGVGKILSRLQETVAALASRFPLQIPLTAGCDSRMILAAAREQLSDTRFFTFATSHRSPDRYMASRLSKRFGLSHEVVPLLPASRDELERWLFLTGRAVGGAAWEMHKSAERLDPNRVLLPGMGGEVGRAFYWRETDCPETTLSAEDLLQRASLPGEFTLVGATDEWLRSLTGFNAFQVLDLFYLEQRLGCWAGPMHHGNCTSRFEMSPFNHHSIFTAMMRLPHEYRARQELGRDVCAMGWPQLVEYPFNEYDGLAKHVFESARFVYRGIKRVCGR